MIIYLELYSILLLIHHYSIHLLASATDYYILYVIYNSIIFISTIYLLFIYHLSLFVSFYWPYRMNSCNNSYFMFGLSVALFYRHRLMQFFADSLIFISLKSMGSLRIFIRSSLYLIRKGFFLKNI